MPSISHEEPSFEEALAALEEAVRLLESGELPLDESLRRYEHGAGLVSLCRRRLDEAESLLRRLVERDGEPVLENEV